MIQNVYIPRKLSLVSGRASSL